jgi:hypothetical protein
VSNEKMGSPEGPDAAVVAGRFCLFRAHFSVAGYLLGRGEAKEKE